jgi:hypothetical protein
MNTNFDLREAHLNARHRKLKRVKLILPALTEATSPYWRPIKYSLFPPLGLATLAAYSIRISTSRFRTSTSSRLI